MTQRRRSSGSSKRRTTVTLPSESLIEAERIARDRKVTLSTVISEALAEGLRTHSSEERASRVLRAYQKAFSGFSEEEMMLLDGIVLDEPVGKRRR